MIESSVSDESKSGSAKLSPFTGQIRTKNRNLLLKDYTRMTEIVDIDLV